MLILGETFKIEVQSLKMLILAETFDQIEFPSVKILILAETFNRNRGSKSENVDFS